jgi:hypothetical protein
MECTFHFLFGVMNSFYEYFLNDSNKYMIIFITFTVHHP